MFIFYLFTLCLSGITGCEQSAQSETRQLLPFSQVDSLIGENFSISGTGKTINPPKGFVQPNDSIVNVIRQTMISEQGYGEGLTLVNCFLDTVNQAGLLITKIDNTNLAGDTAIFINNYRETLNGLYGAENITEASGWIGSIFVKNFVTSDGNIARFYALCFDTSDAALELNYFLPESQLASIIESVHSSVASIK